MRFILENLIGRVITSPNGLILPKWLEGELPRQVLLSTGLHGVLSKGLKFIAREWCPFHCLEFDIAKREIERGIILWVLQALLSSVE